MRLNVKWKSGIDGATVCGPTEFFNSCVEFLSYYETDASTAQNRTRRRWVNLVFINILHKVLFY
jgi:hypothetical protein